MFEKTKVRLVELEDNGKKFLTKEENKTIAGYEEKVARCISVSRTARNLGLLGNSPKTNLKRRV